VRISLKSAQARLTVLLLSFLNLTLKISIRHRPTFLLFLVFCTVVVIGALIRNDIQTANAEAQNMYTRSVHGLQRIGELQYDAQETRRATLYALTTNDSNLQIEYADQSRDADRRVREGIAEYAREATQPAEFALSNRLAHDWTSYLKIRDEVLASILEGSTKEAVDLDLHGGVQAFEAVRQDLNEVKGLYDHEASNRIANLTLNSRRSSRRLIGILSFTFLLSSAAVWAIQRSRMLNAVQLAKLQMDFVASVSHELRTPLAVLSSAADNIADGLVEGKAVLQKYGAVLQNQSRRMSTLVDQILLFASTEDRKNRYILRPLHVSEIIDSVVPSAEDLLREPGVIIDRSIEPEIPMVMGDLSGVSHCLQNLIGNAMKYGGDHPRISIKAFVARTGSSSEHEVRISVKDRGIGIDRSDLNHIFEPFYRSPRVSAAQIHGTGLGLALAKRIAESMGGRLSVLSELSLGSTFTLHLQIAKEESTPATTQASNKKPGSHL
jgi:signal transduction histidine kinase